MATLRENELQADTEVTEPTSQDEQSPHREVPSPGQPGTFEEGLSVLLAKYDNALRELAK